MAGRSSTATGGAGGASSTWTRIRWCAFSVTRTATVPGNGQAIVDVAFDTSRVLEGNRTYVVKANGTRYTGQIVVGDESRDDGPTLGEYDRSGDELPGFTATAALVALAALVAVTRLRGSN